MPLPDGSARRTTVVRLQGGGLDGVGEDIFAYDAAAQLVLRMRAPNSRSQARAAPSRASSSCSTASICRRVAARRRPAAGPTTVAGRSRARRSISRSARRGSRWQETRREDRPRYFGMLSFSLGDPPAATRIHKLGARSAGTHSTFDATSAWTRPLADELAATGAVDVVDLKGYRSAACVDQPANPVLYQLIVDAFPTRSSRTRSGLPRSRRSWLLTGPG